MTDEKFNSCIRYLIYFYFGSVLIQPVFQNKATQHNGVAKNDEGVYTVRDSLKQGYIN